MDENLGFPRLSEPPIYAWWFIPLSKWVITPVISGRCPTYPIYNQCYNPLTKWDEPPGGLWIQILFQGLCMASKFAPPPLSRFINHWNRRVRHMEVFKNGGTPSSHPFIDGIFHEINHPTSLGYLHVWKPQYKPKHEFGVLFSNLVGSGAVRHHRLRMEVSYVMKDTPSSLDGFCSGESHRSKWMRTRGTPILGSPYNYRDIIRWYKIESPTTEWITGKPLTIGDKNKKKHVVDMTIKYINWIHIDVIHIDIYIYIHIYYIIT